METITPTTLASAARISVPYASQILSGVRQPSSLLALRIYRATGTRFGPIVGATDADIDALERIEAARRPTAQAEAA